MLEKEIHIAQNHLVEHLVCASAEEELAATFAFTVSRTMRKTIADPWFPVSGLLEENGGDDPNNPHREIDTIAGDLGRRLVQRFVAQNSTSVSLYIEENHWWDQLGTGPVTRLIVIDPIDGTRLITDESATASSGIAILDENGKFITGAVASLADGRIVVISEGKANRFIYNYVTGEIKRENIMARHEQALRIAMLPDRIPAMQPVFENLENQGYEVEVIKNFGGYPLLDLLFPMGAPIHAMLDLKKGQKLSEPWGYLAREAGAIVEDFTDKPNIDFDLYYKLAVAKDDMNSRVRYGIFQNRSIRDIIQEAVNSTYA